MRRLLLAAALALPVVGRAQLSPAPDPTNPPPMGSGVPAGYFTGPTRSWTLYGCGFGLTSFTGAPSPTPLTRGTTYCLSGRATFGQLAGSQGYDLWIDYLNPPALSPDGTVRYSTLPDVIEYSYRLCAVGVSTCNAVSGTGRSITTTLPWSSAEGRDINLLTGGGFASGYNIASFDLYGMTLALPATPVNYTLGRENVEVRLVATAVPEPATLALTLGGLALVGGIAARRRGVE